jgi:hypothetical protein
MCYTVARVVLPDLRFSEYFQDQNHRHNVDEEDVIDAVIGRRIHISAPYRHNGKLRRRILGKTDSDYLTIICEPAEDFWWVLSAFPSGESDERRARAVNVGDEQS